MRCQTLSPPLFLTALIAFTFLFAGLLTGCLTHEAVDMRISLNEDGDAGSVLLTFYDIDSDESSSKARAADFADVLKDWSYRSDPGELEHAVDRKLWVEGGKLHGSYREYFVDIRELLDGEEYIIDESGIRLFLDPDAQMETNGMVSDWAGMLEETESGWTAHPVGTKADGSAADTQEDADSEEDADHRLVITWPTEVRELWVKIVEPAGDEDAPEPSLSFAEMYEMYLKERSPFDEEVRSVFSHLTYSSLHDFLEQPEEAEKARAAVCVALDEVLALPDPDPEVLQGAVERVSEAGLCSEQCRSAERLAKELLYKERSEQ